MISLPTFLFKNGDAKLFEEEKALKVALKDGWKDTPKEKKCN